MRLLNQIIFIILLIQIPSYVNADLVIEVSGVNNGLKTVLLNNLSIYRQRDNEKLTDTSIRALYLRADDEIVNSLRANGYYQPEIEQSLEQVEENWTARFNVNPGEPVLVKSIELNIISDEPDADFISRLKSLFPLKTGDRLIHGQYESGKVAIQDAALQRGYFDGQWGTHTLQVSTDDYSADIILTFNAGTRYRFGEVIIADTVINSDLVNNLLAVKTGELYEAEKLVETQNTLQNTRYFEQIVVRTGDVDHREKTIPVSIEIQERNKHAYRVGVGYGTDTGARLVGSWDTQYLNMKGHRQETDLRLSLVRSSLSSAYLIPFFREQDAELGITASVSREDTDTSVSNKFDSSVQHLNQRWGWNETISLTYQYEDYRVADLSDASHLLIPSINYWRSVSDNPLYPRRGYRLSADLKGSVKGLISNVHFLQLRLRGKYIHPVGNDGRLIGRSEVGALLASEFSNLPSSLRFFAGGDDSIRGFDLNTLGPLNASEGVIGGTYLATGSVEYEHRLFGKWSAAVFSDFGNAFDDFSEKFEYSVGTGLRWQTPVGLFRLDVAVGLSRDDNPIRLHIILGPEL